MIQNKNELIFESREEMRKYFSQFPVEKRYDIAEKYKIIGRCGDKYDWVLKKGMFEIHTGMT